MAFQKRPWRRPAGERYAPPPHLPRAQVEPGGSRTTVRSNPSRGPHPPASGAAPGEPDAALTTTVRRRAPDTAAAAAAARGGRARAAASWPLYCQPARAGGEAAGSAGGRRGPGFRARAETMTAAWRRGLWRRWGSPSRARRARRRRRADGAASACVSCRARSGEEIRAGGGGGRGAGLGRGRGAGRPWGWQLRQSGGGTLGREPCAPGLQARSSAEGGSEGPGRGRSALLAAGLAPSPRLSRNGSPQPPRGVGGKEGRRSRVERGEGGRKRS